jgi:hypothetical protein
MPVNFTLKYEEIKFTGGDISVRGLGIPEINQLVAVHTEAAVTLFGEIQAKAGKNDQLDIGELIFDVLNRFQAAVAHVIALAADEPDALPTIARLPVDVQLAALEKIATLSFAMDGGAKKFWEIVLNLAREKGDLAEKGRRLLQTFTSGFGLSDPN